MFFQLSLNAQYQEHQYARASSQLTGELPVSSGEAYHAAYPTSSDDNPFTAAGYPTHSGARRNYSDYAYHYDNDDDSDSEMSSTDSEGMSRV